VNYRPSGDATFPAQIRDVEAAVAWVRDNADDLGVAPDRIAAMGHSSGAHLAALASVTGDDAFGERHDASTAVQAVVGISGIYDLMTADEDPDIFRQFLGGTSEEMPDRYRRASPLPAATADAPPTLLVHGSDDKAVPVAQSERYRDRLADLEVETELYTVDGDHMAAFRNEWYDDIVERSVAFLRSNL
jgi:acetyl esterase/lipase